MVSLKRIVYIGLSVRNARRSGEWWRDLLGMEIEKENFNAENWPATWNEVQLIHPDSGFQIGFIEHPENVGEQFSEFRTGLDHIEFEVPSREELEQWQERLDSLGIPHSGIKDDHIIVVRDPDNIQFEFFLPLP
jgi:catechol 2,3-dioxygenase-like lactoylglutathione lyase family enzyme